LVASNRSGSVAIIGGDEGSWLIAIGHGDMSWGMMCEKWRENEGFLRDVRVIVL